MPVIEEEMFFFKGSNERNLLGFMCMPKDRINNNIGIVFCPPFAEEKNISHRVVVETAREIAANGIPVLLFDISGTGDSEGSLREVIVDDWQADIACAIKILKKNGGVENYALWGLRLGAGLSLVHADTMNDVSFLILWQPVVSFKTYIDRFIRNKIAFQISSGYKQTQLFADILKSISQKGIIHVNGYPITERLYNSFSNIDTKPLQIQPSCPTLIMSISKMEEPGISIRKYYENLLLKETLIDTLHVRSESFWDNYWRQKCQVATDSTIEWLKETVVKIGL